MCTCEESKEELLQKTPFWEHLTDEQKNLILANSTLNVFDSHEMINASDTSCMGVVFVLRGEIRISLLSDEGREITLYRLSKGECCVTTASCVIQQITFDTLVSSSEETCLLVIPSFLVKRLSEDNIYFRAFLYETETERFSQTIWVFQELLFKRFDQRLAAYLLKEYEKTLSPDLEITQEEIARDINSAREVVARMLRHFARDGLVEVKRGHIHLQDIDGLRKI